jgi:O-antigen/teichoic acid export membrane protein
MKTKVKLMGLVAIVNIALNAWLIPFYGATGAAIATVISNFVLLAIFYITAQNLVFN